MVATNSRSPLSMALTVLLLIATLLLLVWPLGITGNPYDEKRLLVTTLLLVFVSLFLLLPSLRRIWLEQLAGLPRTVSYLLLIVLLLGLLSTWQARLPGAALTGVALWVVLLSALVGVAALRRVLGARFDLAQLVLLALLFLIYMLLLAATLLKVYKTGQPLDLRLFYVNFSIQRFFNQVQSWTLPLAVLPLIYAAQREWRLLQGILAVAVANWWVLLFISGGRGTLLSVVVAMLVVALLLRRRAAVWLKWQVLTMAGGVMLYAVLLLYVLPLFTSVVTNPTLARTSLSSRGALWQDALMLMTEHPLLGVGPMHFACVDGVRNAHPHNVLLQVAAEWGMPAALLVSILLAWLLYRALISARQEPPQVTLDTAPALLASLCAATVHAQLSGIVVMPLSQLMLVIVGGWSWGALARPAQASSSLRFHKLIWIGAFAVALPVLLYRLAPVWELVGEGKNMPVQADYKPRFWANGMICQEGSSWQK